MKHLTFATLALLTLLIPILAFAQSSLPADLPTDQALEIFVKSLGGLKGAGALAISLIVVQAIMLFFRTPLANFAGKWRFLVVAGLSIVTGFIGMLVAGVDWKLALMHADVLAAVQVFFHQLVKQFLTKSDETGQPPAGA